MNASGDGVTLHVASVTLNDDYIGLGTTGTADANRGAGVYAAAGSSSELIGLNTSGDSGTVANVISGNRGPGVELFGSDMDIVVANRIGTNPAGTAAIPNGGDGVWLTRGSSGNEIGGTEFTDAATGQQNNPTGSKGTVTPVFVIPPLGNLVSGNSHNGVRIDSHSTHNTLNGNSIGTTADGDATLGNGWNGVSIKAANDNSLVGCQFVNNPFVYYNVMGGNRLNGLLVTDANGTKVQGNFFGVGANNTSTVANGLNGIAVNGTSNLNCGRRGHPARQRDRVQQAQRDRRGWERRATSSPSTPSAGCWRSRGRHRTAATACSSPPPAATSWRGPTCSPATPGTASRWAVTPTG